MRITCLVLVAAVALVGSSFAASAQDPGALCDKLAGHPHDPTRVGDGILYEDVDVAAAEPACRDAAAAHPDEPRYTYLVGRVHHVKEDYEAARLSYEAARAAGYPMASFALGLIYEEASGVDQDYVKAAEYYRQAMDGGVAMGIVNLANLYDAGLGVPEDSVEAARLYRLAMEQGDPSATHALGRLYDDGRGVARDPVEAERLYRLAIAGPDAYAAAEAKNSLAWMWAKAGTNLDEAETLALGAVEVDPEEAAYLDTLGWVRYRLGRLADAARDLEQAVVLNGEDPAYHHRLGDIYAAQGRVPEAKAEWQKALDLPPPDPVLEPDWDRAAIERKMSEAD